MTHANADMGVAYWDYLKQFEYRVTIKLGPTYSNQYQEFSTWCHARLGDKYKDWFITSNSKGVYTLFCRSNKWATFLALTWVDNLV
jgi:uncharacterized protein YycO